mmetsp:Transcript_152872/g.266482  ORF Transcript_152872/g.266482 Transcript_152872/m.266482 type:complete len:272 (+) Transcript_152872:670-1485(+)
MAPSGAPWAIVPAASTLGTVTATGSLNSMVCIELSHCLGGIFLIASSLIQPRKNAVCDGRRPHAILDHLFEEPNTCSDIVGLHTAVHQRVVHELIASQTARLDGFCNLQRFVEVPDVAIAFQQRGESDEVWLQRAAGRGDLPEELLRCGQVATFHASIDDGVVGDRVVRDALLRHLSEEIQGSLQVLLKAVALDERRVQDSIAVLASLAHALEDLLCIVQAPALDAGIDHAAIRHGIGLHALLFHLAPNLQDLLNISRLTIGLYKDPESDR